MRWSLRARDTGQKEGELWDTDTQRLSRCGLVVLREKNSQIQVRIDFRRQNFHLGFEDWG